MNFRNPVQSYTRPMMNTYAGHQLRRQKAFTWAADKAVFLCVGRILLVLLPVVLVMNLWFAWSYNHLAATSREVDSTYRVLMDKQIKLRAERAQLFSPEQVQLIAAEKFALHVPGKEQIKFF